MDVLALGMLLNMANQKSARILDSDMDDDMQLKLKIAVNESFKKLSQLSQISDCVKQVMEKFYGPGFIVYLREDDAAAGISFSYKKGTFAKVQYGNYFMMVFKGPVSSTLVLGL